MVDRRFRRFVLGETVNGLGSAISMVALPLVAVLRFHASTLAVASLEAAEWAPALVFGIPAGFSSIAACHVD